MQILEVNALRKVYTTRFGGASVEALKNINFSVENGEYVAIMGESGSGKTTLLNILAGLDKPTSGQVLLDGKDLASLTPKELRQLRQQVSMIFQHFNLLSQRDVRGNIAFAMEIAGMKRPQIEKRIDELVHKYGTTLLFVSHSIEQVERVCERALWIEKGEMRMQGPVKEVCEAYRAGV